MVSDYKKKYLKYKTKYLKLKSKEEKINNMTGGGEKKNKTVYLFKAEWCPHCIGFKPTWENLSKKIGKEVKFVTYDSEENKQDIKDFKVSGFPTIILKVNNKAIEYVGPRDELSLTEFINQY